MGIGSPRLLRKHIAGATLAVTATLTFAPQALADDAVGTSITVGPVTVSATVPVPEPVPAVPTPPAVSAPAVDDAVTSATAVVGTVRTPKSAPATITAAATTTTTRAMATGNGTGSQPPPADDASPSGRPVVAHRNARQKALEQARPSIHPRGNTTTQHLAKDPVRRASFPPLPAPRNDAPASTPDRRPAPQAPERPIGFAGGGAAGEAPPVLLLLAVLTGLALLAAPRLGGVVRAVPRVPKPYAYLLALERPD
jgi:hypothetical protein